MDRSELSIDSFFASLEARLDKRYTEEQTSFMSDLTKSKLAFAPPGAGKTTMIIGGLICLETYRGVSGKKIKALSYTKKATAQLREKHLEACKKLRMDQYVEFRTIDAICTKIVKDNYRLLGMKKFGLGKGKRAEALVPFLKDVAEENGIELDLDKVRFIVNACRKLNSALTFDQIHIESTKEFIDTGLSYEDFTVYRLAMYRSNKLKGTLALDDIRLYALELLTRHPEIAEEIKAETEVLFIDEFQDVSLLELKLLSMLTQEMVAVGDIDQQIYVFKGACGEIVSEFFKLYPHAEQIRLTKSFRCKQEIADYAAKIVIPNEMTECFFEGTGTGGVVKIVKDLDVYSVAERINREYVSQKYFFDKTTKFLVRNNDAVVPIAEALYKLKVPFMVKNYIQAQELKIIEDLCDVIELAINPSNLSKLDVLKKFITEVDSYEEIEECPVYQLIKNKGTNIFTCNYIWKSPIESSEFLEVLKDVGELVESNVTLDRIFNRIYPLYKARYVSKKERYWSKPADYYINLVSNMAKTKTYQRFIGEEVDKAKFIQECTDANNGIECLTMHSAKGLEADRIFVLDAHEGLIPNKKSLDDMVKKECLIDAARVIRNERSLAFVACTRAKEELWVCYVSELASVFKGVNNYSNFDDIYKSYREDYSDVEMFMKFTERTKI